MLFRYLSKMLLSPSVVVYILMLFQLFFLCLSLNSLHPQIGYFKILKFNKFNHHYFGYSFYQCKSKSSVSIINKPLFNIAASRSEEDLNKPTNTIPGIIMDFLDSQIKVTAMPTLTAPPPNPTTNQGNLIHGEGSVSS